MVAHPPSGVATLLPVLYGLQGVIEKGDSVWTLTLGTVYLQVPSIAVKSSQAFLGSHSATDFWKGVGGRERDAGGGSWGEGCGRGGLGCGGCFLLGQQELL